MSEFNSNIPEDLRRKIEATMSNAHDGDLKKINEALQAQMRAYNRTPQEELQGYSPAMCHALRHEWNTSLSPIQFNSELKLEDFRGSKIFNNIRTMLLAVNEADGVKATASGNFYRKFVEAMIDPLLDAEAKEELLRYNKVVNEPDFWDLHEARIVADAAGLLVKRKGIIRVTKKYQRFLEVTEAGTLFIRLFHAYYRKYNIGYRFNRGIDVDWMQHGIRFILYPLSLKAKNWIRVDTLPDAVLHPGVLESLRQELRDQRFLNEVGVVTRYFVRPLHQWGLLEIQWSNDPYYPKPEKLRLSPLFRDFIHFNKDVD